MTTSQEAGTCGKCGRCPIDHRGGECIYPPQADMAATYRAALELVREGLDLPHAKTVGDDEKRGQILQLRLIDVLIMVNAVLDRDFDNPSPGATGHQWSLDYCRERLAERPATGYHPNSARIAYGQYDECAAEGCGHRQGSHWEHAEPDGPRTGCAYLGCTCTAYADAAAKANEEAAAAAASGEWQL